MLHFFIFFLYLTNPSLCQNDYVLPDRSDLPTANKDSKKKDFLQSLQVGGNFSLLFGTITLIDLSPQVSSEIIPKVHLGTGISIIYFNDRFIKYSSTVLGGRVFARWFPLNYLFTHLEYEVLNGEWVPSKKFNIPSFYAGIGYRSLIGSNSGLDVLLLFNLNRSEFSPYSNPTFRIGFMFGF